MKTIEDFRRLIEGEKKMNIYKVAEWFKNLLEENGDIRVFFKNETYEDSGGGIIRVLSYVNQDELREDAEEGGIKLSELIEKIEAGIKQYGDSFFLVSKGQVVKLIGEEDNVVDKGKPDENHG